MRFLVDLIRWFFNIKPVKNEAPSQAVFPIEKEVVREIPKPKVEPPRPSPTFDFLKDNPSTDFLIDLQSIRPLAEQFDIAREDLLKELKRLAPPRKRLFDIFKDAA